MTEQDIWTIKRLLEWTSEFFHSKQLDSPRLCAEILLAEALNCQRIELYTRFDQVPEENLLAVYRDWVKRHAKGEPVAYLVGSKEFYSIKFDVNSNVLIPRPETEHLVLAAIEAADAMAKDNLTILDIGTGSGCVAITLAKQIANCMIVATDISEDALKVATTNAQKLGPFPNLTFLISDVLESIPDDVTPDIIVSNPPYIGLNEVDTVSQSVKEYEPEIALFSGADGTDVIARLIEQSAARLPEGGHLIFETSPIVFDRCLQMVEQSGNFDVPTTIKDYSGHRRIINAKKSVMSPG